MTKFAILAVAALGVFANAAQAWSYKEHIQLTRIAAGRLIDDPSTPAEMKAWLVANVERLPSMEAERDFLVSGKVGEFPDSAQLKGLLWWVCVPDIAANDRSAGNGPPFGHHERLNHFVDLEFFHPEPAKRTYQLDLSSLPDRAAIPRDPKHPTYSRAGFLPLAIDHAYGKLVESLKAKRLGPDAAKPEDTDHALRWAGYVIHYAQDNTQPQHSTMDYKSARYFPGTRTPPNVHSEVEWRLIDDVNESFPELRTQLWEEFARQLAVISDPVESNDPFDATLDVSYRSYRYLPLIGEAAAASVAEETKGTPRPRIDTAAFFRFERTGEHEPRTVLQMKARQTAWAVLRTERWLRQAWDAAQQ